MRAEAVPQGPPLRCRASLRECEANDDLCGLVDIAGADETAAALLIECRGRSEEDLEGRIREVNSALRKAGLPLGCNATRPRTLEDYAFRHDPAEYKVFWDVRKGLIPIVGAAREPGTPPLICCRPAARITWVVPGRPLGLSFCACTPTALRRRGARRHACALLRRAAWLHLDRAGVPSVAAASAARDGATPCTHCLCRSESHVCVHAYCMHTTSCAWACGTWSGSRSALHTHPPEASGAGRASRGPLLWCILR